MSSCKSPYNSFGLRAQELAVAEKLLDLLHLPIELLVSHLVIVHALHVVQLVVQTNFAGVKLGS